jgi:putative phosphoribosyl transferase
MRPARAARNAPFSDRRDAGRQLAERIRALDLQDPVVIALPRGGIPVGFEVARAIDAPLDTLVVRKLGSPANPEYAVGAIAEGGMVIVGQPRDPSVSDEELDRIARRETTEITRRVARYRGTRPLTAVAGRDVILVDDGVATGLTALAAAKALRAGGANASSSPPRCAPRTSLSASATRWTTSYA